MSLGIGIINPKKRKEIEGVSSSSLIDLKATLFSAEENVRRSKAEGTPASRGKLQVKGPPPVRNKGVDERDKRDQEEQEKQLDPAEALAAKMQHYQNMATSGFRDEAERFLVDFERKKWDVSRQGGESSQPDALAVVMAADADGGAAWGGEEQEGLLRELGEGRGKEKERAEQLKAARLAAARKRMKQQQQQQQQQPR